MTTKKTEYLNWDVPTFPSNNIASELDILFTQIDETVYAVDGGGIWTISDSGVEVLPLPSDINFGSDLDAFDNGDGSVTIVSNALSSDDKGTSNGVAELDSSGNVPSSQLPSIAISETDIVADKSERLLLNAEKGDVAIQQDERQSYILKNNDPTTDSSWSILESPTSDLTSVYGRTGDVTAETGDYTHNQIGGQSSDDHHTRYSDDEALSVIGTEPISHPSYATLSDTPITSLGDVFHVDGDGLYVKTDGVDAIDNSDTPLQVHIDDTSNPHNVTNISGNADTVDGKHASEIGNPNPDPFSSHLTSTQSNAENGLNVNIYQYVDITSNYISVDSNSQISIQNSGEYELSWMVNFHRTGSGSRNIMYSEIKVNGSNLSSRTRVADYIRTNGNGDECSTSSTTILQLNAGDTIRVYANEERGGESGNDIERAFINIKRIS